MSDNDYRDVQQTLADIERVLERIAEALLGRGYEV